MNEKRFQLGMEVYLAGGRTRYRIEKAFAMDFRLSVWTPSGRKFVMGSYPPHLLTPAEEGNDSGWRTS